VPIYYDESAVQTTIELEKAILRLHPPNQGEFIAILNAIEAHIEEADGSPQVVEFLAQALLELGKYRSLPVEHVRQLERKLGPVKAHVSAHAARRR
jgi:hypothetical protein